MSSSPQTEGTSPSTPEDHTPDAERKRKIARELMVKDNRITNADIQAELKLMGFDKGIAPEYLASVRAELGVSGPNTKSKRPAMSDEQRARVSQGMRKSWAKRKAKEAPVKKAKKKVAKKPAKKKKAAKKPAHRARMAAKGKAMEGVPGPGPQAIIDAQTHIPADMLKYLMIVASRMKQAGIFELTIDDKGNIKADVRKVMFLNVMK